MKSYQIYIALCMTIAMLITSASVNSQPKANYILTKTTISQSSPEVENYQFFDGFGRGTAEATNGMSGNGNFTYSFHEYLGENLKTRSWLPVVGNSTVSHLSIDDVVSQSLVQYNDNSAFVNNEYDALGRMKKQYNAGAEWKSKPMTISYVTNTSEDIKKYKAIYSPTIINYFEPGTLQEEGYYEAGTLLGISRINEDGIKITTYTDASGKVICERRGEDNDTYFIYSDVNELMFVLMPEYQKHHDSESFDKYVFQFGYDKRGNVEIKKLPGCEPIEERYDLFGRLGSIQDGELREKDFFREKWEKGLYRFRLYDKLGRFVIQGLSTTRPHTSWEFVVQYDCSVNGIENTNYRMPDSVYLGPEDRWESPARQIKSEENVEATNYDGYVNVDKDDIEIVEEGEFQKEGPLMPPPPEPILWKTLNITPAVIEIVNYYDDYSFLTGANKDAFVDLNYLDSSVSKGMLTGSVVLASDSSRIASVYSYDILGNLIEVQEKGLDGNIVKTENTYTYTNKLATSKVSIDYLMDDLVEYGVRYGYNPNNDFMTDVTYQAKIGGLSTDECKIVYTYDQLGRIANISRPISNGKGDVSYDYDIHGWLTNITSNSFSEQLHYHDGAGTPLYSGNISSVTWKNGASGNKGYRYAYDELNRLVNSEYGENNFSRSLGAFDEKVGYDDNGNITTLVRNGVMQDGSLGAVDNLSLRYNGNQLQNVEEKARPVFYTNSQDIKKSSDNFRYNRNGALVVDGTRGITNIRYDDNNNPIRIQFDNGNVTKYVYTVTGQKLRTIHYTAPKNIHVEMGCDYEDIEKNCLSEDRTDYFLDGKVVYENSKFSKILFDGGYIDVSDTYGSIGVRPVRGLGVTDGDYKSQLEQQIGIGKIVEKRAGFKFYNKDHQGNNREVLDKNGRVVQKNDYYPYGSQILYDPYTINECNQPYKYNGKEFDMMHGLNTYDYGARQYSPVLPVWDRVDPLTEKYYNVSPYAYCMNDPVNYVDPDGKDTWEVNGQGYVKRTSDTKEYDRICTTNIQGTVVASLQFDYGTVNHSTVNLENGRSYEMFSINGDNCGRSIFEMLSQNTDVEWSLGQFDKVGTGINRITTTHSDYSEEGMNSFLYNNPSQVVQLRNSFHNHPNGNPDPSFKSRDGGIGGDMKLISYFDKFFPENHIQYAIYTLYAGTWGYHYYDKNTKQSAIRGRQTELPELVVNGNAKNKRK